MSALIQLGIFICLLLLGYIFGRRAEKKHYQRIFEGEEKHRNIFLSSERLPSRDYVFHHGKLVCGSVVIAVDYFKVIVAGLKSIFGGRLTSYESLLDRARRESLLRMQDQASELGATAIINIKFETSRISGNEKKGIGSIEVLAYGTAMMDRK
ncbi:MAG: hypothetical protein ACJAYK_002180 [Crocinitomicaceae bacterium]|jgi:uncharacterized protein YbjQ (UPF0145 family)